MSNSKNIYSIDSSYLPQRVKRALKGQEENIDNFNFKLQRGANFVENESGKKTPTLYIRKSLKDHEKTVEDKKAKIEFTEQRHVPNYSPLAKKNEVAGFLEKVNFFDQLGQSNRRSIAATCDKSISYQAEIDRTMVVGLGNSSVFEVGITLHHTYGIPYIPGSGIKGAVRNYVIDTIFESKEGEALKDEGFQQIFGFADPKLGAQKGGIVFADAFPLELPTIEEDVINSHYQDYYQGSAPPADWLSPNPVFFHTVVNTRFQFILGLRYGTNPICLRLAEQWFLDCAQEHGFGAKTMVGYGYFKNLKRA